MSLIIFFSNISKNYTDKMIVEKISKLESRTKLCYKKNLFFIIKTSLLVTFPCQNKKKITVFFFLQIITEYELSGKKYFEENYPNSRQYELNNTVVEFLDKQENFNLFTTSSDFPSSITNFANVTHKLLMSQNSFKQ